MEKLVLPITCPQCAKELVTTVEVDPIALAPEIRGGTKPTGVKYSYKISSEEIKKFIIQKAHQYVPDASLEITPRYCEKKQRKESEVHHSYASFMIAFSHHVIKNNGDGGWFQQIGETGDNVMLVDSLFNNMIRRWCYDPKYLNEWLNSYKKLEKLEDGFGMDEKFINDLKVFSKPRGIKTRNNDIWVFFMASPEAILQDYFSDVKSGNVAGKLEIRDIRLLSKDIIEYDITLDPNNIILTDNPHVRQILSGEEKIK